MSSTLLYKPEYADSYALIIGINDYQKCSPLSYAKHDAEEVAGVLQKSFHFLDKKVTILLDSQATKNNIMSAYLKYAQDDDIKEDDRVLVFFAGHGLTKASLRGEVGYLVPFDGDPNDINTLIRWDELTRNADFIPAKHIFFLMDACYGGLAFVRQPSFGTMRFLKDMLRRRSRQVLTAGKADEPVADGQGVRPNHSIFTSHLLNALEGAAATTDGLISASGVMAYVYEKVSGDQYSHQTPHYGFIDGDGDFIFDLSMFPKLMGPDDVSGADESGKKEEDIIINVSPSTAGDKTDEGPVVETMKELLSDPNKRIKLNDFVQKHIKAFVEKVDLRHFPVQGATVTNEEFLSRIKKYEAAAEDLQKISVLITQWGNPDQLELLRKIFVRIAEVDRGSSGLVVWLNLPWYPVQLIMYSAGIAAVAAENYEALKIILETPIHLVPDTEGKPLPLNVVVSGKLADIFNQFKALPGHERHYVPRSEYLFKALQPTLEDLLFLGRSYEDLFDKFEMFTALQYADTRYSEGEGDDVWGPVGRFGWKGSRSSDTRNPMKILTIESEMEKENWKPIKAGMFGSSFERFRKVFEAFNKRVSKMSFFLARALTHPRQLNENHFKSMRRPYEME